MSCRAAGRFKLIYEYMNAKKRQVDGGQGTNHRDVKVLEGASSEAEAVLQELQVEVRRIAHANGRQPDKLPWSAVIVDEAHFLKNPISWWGLHAVMLGAHARRFIAVTGTPHTTSAQDLATLCAMIDPNAMITPSGEKPGPGQQPASQAWWGEMLAAASTADEAVPDHLEPGWGDNPALARLSAAERAQLSGGELDRIRKEGDREMDAAHAQRLARIEREVACRALQLWRGTSTSPNYFLRREKATIGLTLPPKTFERHLVLLSPTEWDRYQVAEWRFISELWYEWKQALYGCPQTRAWERRMFLLLVAQMQVMRMVTTHAAVHGGREFTALFSPTRRFMHSRLRSGKCQFCHELHFNVKALVKRMKQACTVADPNTGLLCTDIDRVRAALEAIGLSSEHCPLAEEEQMKTDRQEASAFEDEDEAQGEKQDDDADLAEAAAEEEAAAVGKERWGDCLRSGASSSRDLKVPEAATTPVCWWRSRCRASVPHMGHGCCLAALKELSGGTVDCPRCASVVQSLQCGGDDDGEGGSLIICKDVLDANGVSLGGFRLSSKQLALRRLLGSLPANEKVCVWSLTLSSHHPYPYP